MSEDDILGLTLENFKWQHPNHKCINCKHQFVYAYEDDSPAGRTPYHWWLGTCDATNQKIESNKIPPDDCPFEEKSASSTKS